MTTNTAELRSLLLTNGRQVIEEVINRATGKGRPPTIDPEYVQIVWKAIIPMLQNSEDLARITGISDGSISARVDNVLEQVAKGTLTIQQGKRLIEMLQAGFNITELPELVAKLQQ